jgi:hypothetical protein
VYGDESGDIVVRRDEVDGRKATISTNEEVPRGISYTGILAECESYLRLTTDIYLWWWCGVGEEKVEGEREKYCARGGSGEE